MGWKAVVWGEGGGEVSWRDGEMEKWRNGEMEKLGNWVREHGKARL
jgi:hypothetical protein